ncbi:MAG: hypothetical protein JWR89_2181 [Tardiphaga sp.]|uniref:hypothetical protein n=1 Tax=Tardiphaga sp. TaxID=1926292 RepID=UPI00261EEEAB|nr:hypothetical protein [Tardiphaga sp.]MDB5502279.1 hypothetical protein [Tardiphaga sp.]
MTYFQLYALFAPLMAAVLFIGFAQILVRRDFAAYRRFQAQALPPEIQEAARAANEKFIADALRDMAQRPAA